MAADGEGKLDQRSRQNIGDDQVERPALAEDPPREPRRRDRRDFLPRAVQRRIGRGDARGGRVDVAREHRYLQRAGDGDGKNARAGADVEGIADGARLADPVDGKETAQGAAMVAGAEGLVRLDLDGDVVRPDTVAVVPAVDKEASGTDRL